MANRDLVAEIAAISGKPPKRIEPFTVFTKKFPTYTRISTITDNCCWLDIQITSNDHLWTWIISENDEFILHIGDHDYTFQKLADKRYYLNGDSTSIPLYFGMGDRRVPIEIRAEIPEVYTWRYGSWTAE